MELIRQPSVTGILKSMKSTIDSSRSQIMNRQFFAALFLTAATVVLSPAAQAAESKAVENIQATRLEHLNNQTKAIDNIQSTRLERLNNQTKAVSDIQSTRLERLDMQTKAVDDVQAARLAGLDARSKANLR
jgi:virulence-associated protein VapD